MLRSHRASCSPLFNIFTIISFYNCVKIITFVYYFSYERRTMLSGLLNIVTVIGWTLKLVTCIVYLLTWTFKHHRCCYFHSYRQWLKNWCISYFAIVFKTPSVRKYFVWQICNFFYKVHVRINLYNFYNINLKWKSFFYRSILHWNFDVVIMTS